MSKQGKKRKYKPLSSRPNHLQLQRFYERSIPSWRDEWEGEILHSGQKDYPSTSSLEELIELAHGNQMKAVPPSVESVRIALRKVYLERKTVKKFKPTAIEDFITPQILAYDANLKLKKGVDWEEVEDLHRNSVEGAVTAIFYSAAIEAKVKAEKYGKSVIELVYPSSDPAAQKALDDLTLMLRKKLPNLVAKFEKEARDPSGVVHNTLVNRIEESRKNAPPLASFLPKELDPVTRKGMKALLYPHVGESQTAKFLADAITGVFRCLLNEFKCDLQNEMEKVTAQMRSGEEISYEDAQDQQEKGVDDENGHPRLKATEFAGKLSNKGILDERIESSLIEHVKEELEKPENKKLKLYFETCLKKPNLTDSELADHLNIHRNTVGNYRKELRVVFKEAISIQSAFWPKYL